MGRSAWRVRTSLACGVRAVCLRRPVLNLLARSYGAAVRTTASGLFYAHVMHGVLLLSVGLRSDPAMRYGHGLNRTPAACGAVWVD